MTKGSNLSRITRQHLQTLQAFGVRVLPAGTGVMDLPAADSPAASSEVVREPRAELADRQPPNDTPDGPQSNPASPATTARATTTAPVPVGHHRQAGLNQPYSAPVADRNAQLNVLAAEVAECTHCDELLRCRRQTVFGVGNPDARLVLLGEAPGEQEDRQGEPFVGAAGQLLDKILAACGLNRHEDVYILNTIKCRPPQNRNPRPEELENCSGFLQRQLDLLQPEFICCLGSVAAKTLLQTNLSVGRLRKQFHPYRGSRVLVTYHPAYLLRTSSAKKHAWDDMQLLMREMGIQIPSPK